LAGAMSSSKIMRCGLDAAGIKAEVALDHRAID
jgi:hypothetical protein